MHCCGWLVERYERSVVLLEIGVSAGLNLRADRFAYVAGGRVLGDRSSPLIYDEPWRGSPVVDAAAAARRLRVADRAGCDLSPIDPGTTEGRRTLESYVWPDEPERLARLRAALEVAARCPIPIDRASASDWLAARLAGARSDHVVVVWQSIVRQYLPESEWTAIEALLGGAEVAWITFEPASELGRPDHVADVGLTCRIGREEHLLARCGYHGPPVRWYPARCGTWAPEPR